MESPNINDGTMQGSNEGEGVPSPLNRSPPPPPPPLSSASPADGFQHQYNDLQRMLLIFSQLLAEMRAAQMARERKIENIELNVGLSTLNLKCEGSSTTDKQHVIELSHEDSMLLKCIDEILSTFQPSHEDLHSHRLCLELKEQVAEFGAAQIAQEQRVEKIEQAMHAHALQAKGHVTS